MYEELSVTQINIDSKARLAWEAYDLNGSTGFRLSGGSWELRKSLDGSLVDSGNVVVYNDISDAAGNTTSVAIVSLDASGSNYEPGYFYLAIKLELSSGQSRWFKVPIEIVDVREAV